MAITVNFMGLKLKMPGGGASFKLATAQTLGPGTDVVYAEQHPAQVVALLPNGDVRIKFDDQDLIPPEMDVDPKYLEWTYAGVRRKFVNAKLRCPKCDVPWKETLGFRFSFFDCPICGAKKEDYAGS